MIWKTLNLSRLPRKEERLYWGEIPVGIFHWEQRKGNRQCHLVKDYYIDL